MPRHGRDVNRWTRVGSPPLDPARGGFLPDLHELLHAELGDRYALEDEIGRGGMATVFLVRDLRHDRRLALKVLDPEVAPVSPERFAREIRITARLQHPHILPLIDSGSAGGLHYYITPYVPGETLRMRIARQGRLPMDEALGIAADLATALDFAHRQGIVHRDVKPDNVLLSEGQAILCDFGIARALGAGGETSLTATGATVGTPAYTSPEQAAGARELDSRTDVYGLACVLYEMLAGRPPFGGATPALLRRQLRDPPPPLRSLRPDAPVAIERLLAAALAKRPEERPSAAEFAGAVSRAALGGAAAGVRRPSAVLRERAGRALRSDAARWAAIVLGAVVVVALWLNMVRRAMKGSGSQYDDFVSFSRDLLFRRVNVYREYDPAVTSITKYPPPFALLLAPLVPLPAALGASLWFFLNLSLAAAATVLAGRAVEIAPSGRWGGTLFWLPLLLAAGMVGSNLETAQVNILILFLVCSGLLAFRRGREVGAGALLGVVTSLKLTPGLFLLYFAWKGRWRVVLGSALGLALALIVLPLPLMGPDHYAAVMRGWLRDLMPFVTQGTAAEGAAGFRHTNQSLGAVVHRFLTLTPAGGGREGYYVNIFALDAETAALVVRALSVALLLFLAWSTRPPLRRLTPLELGFEWSLVVIAGLFLSPVSWINHYVALLLPFAACAAFLRERPPGEAGRRSVLVALVVAVVLVDASASRLLQAWSLPFLGTAALFAAMAWGLATGAVGRAGGEAPGLTRGERRPSPGPARSP